MNKSDKKFGIVHQLISAARMHRTLFEDALQGAGIHGSQHRTLRIIEQSENPPSQKEIAERLEISTASAAVTLKKLEKSGYITREASTPDNRRNSVCITDKGRQTLKNTCIVMSQVDENMFDGFTDSELKALNSYLERMNSNLKSNGKEQAK